LVLSFRQGDVFQLLQHLGDLRLKISRQIILAQVQGIIGSLHFDTNLITNLTVFEQFLAASVAGAMVHSGILSRWLLPFQKDNSEYRTRNAEFPSFGNLCLRNSLFDIRNLVFWKKHKDKDMA